MKFTRRQLPDGDEVFFDHVAWMVPDMDAASAAFAKLGFPLTPYSPHTAANSDGGAPIRQGTANRLAMLETGYLEILCTQDGVDDHLSRHLNSCLARYTGIHLVAAAVADAAAHHARLTEDGFEPLPLVPLRRVIEAEDGSEVEVAFAVVRPPLTSNPEGRMQLLTHYTPEHMWQARYVAKDNAIIALTGAIAAVDDPTEAIERLSKVFSVLGRMDGSDGVLDFGRGEMRFTSATGLGQQMAGLKPADIPCVAALTFFSSDMEKTRNYMAGAGVKLLADTADQIVVDPSEAMGAALVITPEPA